MKALLVGLGGFGGGWYRKLRSQYADIELAVADTDSGKRMAVEADGIPFYENVREAIERERPDLLINVTPREIHKRINELAFDHKLPVFCEKPIADNYEDAAAMVQRAEQEQIPFMIAENYRTFPAVRKLKQLLDEGAIGELRSMECDFFRQRQKITLERDEVLEEVIIHHFDLLRYLSGREVSRLYASRRHVFHIVMDLQAGIQASFRCSLTSQGRETQWAGDWRIEGSLGCLTFAGGMLELVTAEGVRRIEDFSDVDAPGPFTEFLRSLEENRPGETNARDYLKNQALADYTRRSLRTGVPMDPSDSWGYGPAVIRNFLRAELTGSVSHGGEGLVHGSKLFGSGDFDTPLKFLHYTVIPPGSSIGLHGHREDEELYILLEGSGLMTVNGRTYRVEAGDIVLNKPWWRHGLRNDGDVPMKAIIFEVGIPK